VASKSDEGYEWALRFITRVFLPNCWKLWVVFGTGLARWRLHLDQVLIRPRPGPDPGIYVL